MMPNAVLDDAAARTGYTMNAQEEESSESEVWSRLECATANIREATGRFMLTERDLIDEDPTIIDSLKTKLNIDFDPPRAPLGIFKSYVTQGSGGFVLFTVLATCLYRLSLPTPLGLADLAAIVGTRVFWEGQEWAIHARWFHGAGNGRAMKFFKSHDRHHDLPYYHFAAESMRVTVIWFLAVWAISGLATIFLGASCAIVTTCFATYQMCAVMYAVMHAIVHTRIPLTGWLKSYREDHIKHHISPSHHLNMGPNNVDRIMKTASYDTRRNKTNKTN